MSYWCPAQGHQPGHLLLGTAIWHNAALFRAVGGCSALRECMLLRCASWDLQTPKATTVPLPNLLEMSWEISPSTNFCRATFVR